MAATRSPLFSPSRRGLLAGGASLAAAAGLAPRVSHATSLSAGDRKFIFVFAIGGWDPTRVFADGFDHDVVDMEAEATRASIGDLAWISHPDRPEVDTFFRGNASRTAIVQGLMVPSIAHEACFILALTGRPSDAGSDWPSILGEAAMARYIAPTLVVGGPAFPGVMRQAVVQSGVTGQLADLLSGSYRDWGLSPAGATLSVPSRQLLDQWVRARGHAAVAGAPSEGARAAALAFENAVRQSEGLRAQSREIDFTSINNLGDSMTVAADALANGVSRCVMLCEPVNGERGFDSHTTNDDLQNVLFGDLFTYLNSLMLRLDALPGERTPTLAEETCVVVFSEMGRTPWLNSAGGKDHWPYTSAMLIGSGVRGGQVIGGFDSDWIGQPVDPETGAPLDGGVAVTCQSLGATLLAMGDVDPAEFCPEAEPLPALAAG